VFQLGEKYAKAFDLTALGQDGKPVGITMGSYGVGVTRAVAALAEQTYDDKGLCWPRAVAPADVHVVAASKDEELIAAAVQLSEQLEALGVEVIVDDRKAVSPGVKFKDAELLGVPTIVIVGKGLAEGNVEVKDRRTDERQSIPVGTAAETIVALVRG
jgi:prolyl-tRNA synthetase